MGSQSSTPLPAPGNWQDFEHLCWDLWRAQWGDPEALRHGRSGQPQHGVDVYGRHNGAWVGVQCKRVEELTEKFLRDEVEKAKGFKPGLSHFILATSDTKKDMGLEAVARQLADAADPPFRVSVMYWPDIWERLCTYPEKIRRHFPAYYGPHFGPTAPPLEGREVEDSEQARFYFGARHIPLLGRDDELAQLLDFATQGDSKPRWWLLGGEGGAGKSRLALELALRCEDLGWHSGFVKWGGHFDWDAWEPDRPCLLVVDYAQKDAEGYGLWLHGLCDRRSGFAYKVRVLLLERDLNGTWLGQLMGSGSHQARLETRRYLPPRTLPPLSADVLWQIVETVFAKKNKPLPPRDKALSDLTRIDPHGRPLFAALFADALAEGGDTAHWDDQTLIRAILKREADKFWKPKGITDDDLNLLALATMTGGLDLTSEITAELRQVGLIEADIPRNRSRYSALCNRKVTTHLFPLEPDILGELFVLDRIDKDCTADPSLAELLWRHGWRLKPMAMAQFLDRAARDFTHLLPLDPLTAPPEAEGPVLSLLWAMLTFNLISIMGNANRLADAELLHDRLWALAQTHGDQAAIRLEWAKGVVNLITVLSDAGRLADAELLLVRLWDLAQAHGDDAGIRLHWAKGAVNLITALGGAGCLVDATSLHDRLWELAQAQGDDEAEIRLAWARGAFNLISVLGDAGRLADTEPLHDRLWGLAQAHGNETEIRLEWAKGAFNRAVDFLKRGDTDNGFVLLGRLQSEPELDEEVASRLAILVQALEEIRPSRPRRRE